MKTQIFLQARMGSTRTPGKALLKILGKTIIELIVERLGYVNNIDKIILTTSLNPENEKLVAEAKRLGIDYFQGSEENVLDRFFEAAKKFNPDAIVRITADCPLIDPELINQGLKIFKGGGYDMVSNVRERSYPDGFDFEIFKMSALEKSWQDQLAGKPSEVISSEAFSPTKHIHNDPQFTSKDLISRENLAGVRLTLDYPEDYEIIKKIYEDLYREGELLSGGKIIEYVKNNPKLMELNKKYIRLDYGLNNTNK